MKQILILILFVYMGLSLHLHAQTKQVITYYDYQQLHPKEVYTVLTTPPFLKHGTYKVFNKDGSLFQVSNFFKGAVNGTCIEYFIGEHSKNVKVLGTFKMGKKDGAYKEYTYNDEGKYILIEEDVYLNDKKVSEKSFYPTTGELYFNKPYTGKWFKLDDKKDTMILGTCKNGHPIGVYYDFGAIDTITIWYNDKGAIIKQKSPDQDIALQADNIHYLITKYYKGFKQEEFFAIPDPDFTWRNDGTYKEYYGNGNLLRECEYSKGQLVDYGCHYFKENGSRDYSK